MERGNAQEVGSLQKRPGDQRPKKASQVIAKSAFAGPIARNILQEFFSSTILNTPVLEVAK